MPRNPTAVRGAPEYVVGLMIEDPLKRSLGIQVVSGRRVPNSFWFSC